MKGRTFFSRFEVDPLTRGVEYLCTDDKSLDWWANILEDPTIAKVFHNHKFDCRMLDAVGIKVKGQIHDTMYAMHVLRTLEPTLGLKPLCKKYLGIEDTDEKDLHSATMSARREAKKKGWKIAEAVQADYWLAPPKLLEKYSRQDAYRTILLWQLLEEKLHEEGLWKIYEDEMRLAPVTYKMETRGFRIIPELAQQEIVKNKVVMKASKRIYEKECPGLNVDSPQQLSAFIYGNLHVKPEHFTPNGNPKVSGDVLLKIDNPVVKAILDFKASEKAISNFFQRYLNSMVRSGQEWVLHPDFQQIGPVTGRYSCRNPNLQNVADGFTTRSSIPIQARTPFCPRQGYVWYHFDYSQIEMWIFAALAKEEKMLDALLSGRDLHTETANAIWGKGTVENEAKRGLKTSRHRAKMMNFGIIYGIGAKSLAVLNKTTEDEARKDLENYRNAFPKIDIYMDRISRFGREHGYVEGPMGRRWQIDPDRSYTACNYMVQGSAAQVIKAAMVKVDAFFESNQIDGGLVSTIHDEHIDEIRIGQDNLTVLRKIKRLSEGFGGPFGLPKLPVEVAKTTTSWSAKEKIKI